MEQEKPILEALFSWANELKNKTAPKLAEKDENWTEKLLPIAAPDECKVPE